MSGKITRSSRRLTKVPQLEPVVEVDEETESPTKRSDRKTNRPAASGTSTKTKQKHSAPHNSHAKNSFNSTAKSGFNTTVDHCIKKYLQSNICKLLEESKSTSKTHPKIIAKLNDVYYKEKGSFQDATSYQYVFTAVFMKALIVPFKSEKSPKVERIIKLITEVVQTFGTEANKQNATFTLRTVPLFLRVLKYLQNDYFHYEDRPLIRFRVLELIENILAVHSSNPLIPDVMKKSIRELLSSRLRDKFAIVRAKAASALTFFLDGVEPRKLLKYHALYDPNGEVRKSSIIAMKTCDQVPVGLFFTKAFDSSHIVGLEAFKAISGRPMTLKQREMQMLLHWGLKHRNDIVRRYVVEHLIPKWIEESNGILKFLERLDLSFKPKTTACILNGIIRDNTEETFEKLDKSFLNESKLVPINALSSEKMVYWLYLCSKFKDTKYCMDKLLPSASVVVPYLSSIIEKIHFEYEQAELEDKEEEVTYLLCLSHAIRIAGLCDFEESTRRDLEELMTSILIDPILDEAPLLVVATDTLYNIVDARRFEEIITGVVQQIFDPTEPDTTSTSRRRQSIGSNMNMSHNGGRDVENGGEGIASLLCNESPVFQPVTASTPLTKGSRASVRNSELKGEEKVRLKEKLANMGFERNKLICKMDAAKDVNDFLEANRFLEEINVLMKQEDDLRNLLGMAEAGKAVASKEDESRSASKIAEDLARNHDKALKGLSHLSSKSDVIISQPLNTQAKISDSGLLRGIVIGTRFMVWHSEVIPSIRQFIDKEIGRSLICEDTRVRIQTLQFLCMFAMHDKREARKVMAAQIRALSMDIPDVQAAAFRSTVDLLLNYDYEDFKFAEGEDIIWPDLPDCLNSADATKEEMEKYFVSFLSEYACGDKDKQNIKQIEGKVEGMLKLLLRGAVTIHSESLISQLLCMWTDPAYAGTGVCSNIADWLPRYTHLRLVNGQRVAKGLMLSLERILNYEEDDEDCSVQLDNAMKLCELVLSSISSEVFRKFPEGNLIQSSLAVDLLELILENPIWRHTNFIARILNRLDINDEVQALKIVKLIGRVLVTYLGVPKTLPITRTKSSLINLHRRLSRVYPTLPALEELTNESSESETETPAEEGEANKIFSDSSAASADIFDHSEIDEMQGTNSDRSIVENHILETDIPIVNLENEPDVVTSVEREPPVVDVQRKQSFRNRSSTKVNVQTRSTPATDKRSSDEDLAGPSTRKRIRLDKNVSSCSLPESNCKTKGKESHSVNVPERLTRSRPVRL